MAFEAIDLHGCVAVAADAEVILGGCATLPVFSLAWQLMHSLRLYFVVADALVHGLVALVIQQLHVVAAHVVGSATHCSPLTALARSPAWAPPPALGWASDPAQARAAVVSTTAPSASRRVDLACHVLSHPYPSRCSRSGTRPRRCGSRCTWRSRCRRSARWSLALLRHLEHGGLRAVHDAVVAFEALAAAHAALGLGQRLRFGQRSRRSSKLPSASSLSSVTIVAHVARQCGEVAEEQLVVRNHVTVGAVVEVVHAPVLDVGAAHRFVHFLTVRPFRSSCALGRSGERRSSAACPAPRRAGSASMPSAAIEPWPIAVVSRCGRTTSPPTKMPGLPVHLVVLVGVDHALAVVEFLQAGEVDRLADGGDDQVGR